MINIITVPAFNDNYIWLFHEEGSDQAYVVDPGTAEPVLNALTEQGLSLAGILITHHHNDHIGGISDLLKINNVPVFGVVSERIPATEIVVENQLVSLAGIRWRVLSVPGHTREHIAFYGEPEGQDPVLFCGDALFSAGCGRLFEGDAKQLYEAMTVFKSLPDTTKVFCAHEYTLANLSFASTVEPDNSEINSYLTKVKALQNKGLPSIPSTISQEKLINPFLRWDKESVLSTVKAEFPDIEIGDVDTLRALRAWKDNF